jgi:hypothetical protein
MSVKKTHSVTTYLTKTSLIVGLIAFCANDAVAIPLSEKNNNNNSRQGLLQLISQNNSEPPEVIIDDDPNNSGNSGDNYPPTTSADTRFTCDYVDGEYTVMYNPENQNDNAYPWAIPSALGGGWTPERRCNEITSRLESYRADGLLEMSTGVENGTILFVLLPESILQIVV